MAIGIDPIQLDTVLMIADTVPNSRGMVPIFYFIDHVLALGIVGIGLVLVLSGPNFFLFSLFSPYIQRGKF